MAIGIFMIVRGWRQNRQAAMDDVYATEVNEDSSSVTSASTDWGFPLTELQERSLSCAGQWHAYRRSCV